MLLQIVDSLMQFYITPRDDCLCTVSNVQRQLLPIAGEEEVIQQL